MTRKISDEEKKLWKIATRGVRGKEIDDFIAPSSAKDSKTRVKITLPEELLPVKRPAPKAVKHLVAGERHAMDSASFERLKKGRVKISATIDLHGMWLARAHVAVREFLEMSHAAGKRCVLVITGKGGLSGDGKIRAELPKWLNDSDLRPLVLSFTAASSEHGGAGAFYVYLRK